MHGVRQDFFPTIFPGHSSPVVFKEILFKKELNNERSGTKWYQYLHNHVKSVRQLHSENTEEEKE